jgi:hypothetical protein
VTRVATPATEPALLDVARCGTTAHVERLVRAWRQVDRSVAAQATERRHARRQLHTWVDDDGMVVIRGRLTPELGAVVQRALDAAADRLLRESAKTPPPASVTDEVTSAQRRTDAVGLLAEAALATDLDRGTADDRAPHRQPVVRDALQRRLGDRCPLQAPGGGVTLTRRGPRVPEAISAAAGGSRGHHDDPHGWSP